MWFNFHTHSTYCDGKSSLQQIADEAKRLNFISLGFSSHAPLPFACAWCMKKENLDTYLREVNTFKKIVPFEIYTGLEVDFIPQVMSPADFQSKLNYTIGSVHFVEKFLDGRRWEIDGPHTLFLEGLAKIFKNKFKEACIRYFELTREMMQHAPPDVVGHLDKIKMQNAGHKFFNESDPWYVQQIKLTLAEIKKAGAIIEINTRGVYQKKTDTPYPSPWVMELIRQNHIPITVNSDAHHANDLINQFPETLALLKEIGFKELFILTNKKWKPFAFDATGIKLS
ncbi:MAG: histidinol-phosphatase [Bacteroidetes bacterium]|nr:histidinol-phosphatase [Bacteroidota bacterium]